MLAQLLIHHFLIFSTYCINNIHVNVQVKQNIKKDTIINPKMIKLFKKSTSLV